VTVDPYTTISLSTAMACTLLDSLSTDEVIGRTNSPLKSQAVETAVLSLATDPQVILGEAMDTATTIFPQRLAPPKRGTILHHL
jgi:hypothetical protein